MSTPSSASLCLTKVVDQSRSILSKDSTAKDLQVALGIIILIGALVGAGVTFPHISSYFIGGSGLLLAGILIYRGCCYRAKAIEKIKPIRQSIEHENIIEESKKSETALVVANAELSDDETVVEIERRVTAEIPIPDTSDQEKLKELGFELVKPPEEGALTAYVKLPFGWKVSTDSYDSRYTYLVDDEDLPIVTLFIKKTPYEQKAYLHIHSKEQAYEVKFKLAKEEKLKKLNSLIAEFEDTKAFTRGHPMAQAMLTSKLNEIKAYVAQYPELKDYMSKKT